MKVYQVKIEIKDSEPLIWRRVLISASMSFQGLHRVIQRVLDFKDQHLYMFHLPDHTLKVTTDPEALEVYQEYLENKEQIEKTLGALNTPFAREQLEKLRTEVRRPSELAIAPYVQVDGTFEYVYDFADNWEIVVSVEGVLEDYALEYPLLLAGEEGAPVENMGGFDHFKDFLAAYHNPEHPDHPQAKVWGDQVGFTDYDGEAIQERLKAWRE